MVKEMWRFRDESVATVDLDGFEVQARDGACGKVVRTTGGGDTGYLVVDPGVFMPLGRQILVPAGLVETVDLEGEKVSVGIDREQLRNAPAFDPGRPLDERARTAFGGYYGSMTEGRRRTQRAGATGRRASPGSRSRASSSATRRPQSRSRSQARKEPTKAELYSRAKRLGIEGRSKMDKARLARAVERHAGRTGGRGATRARAHPVEVQAFLEGVGYPTGKQQLVREAESQGASQKVRATLERVPERRYSSPTEVSEAIGELS